MNFVYCPKCANKITIAIVIKEAITTQVAIKCSCGFVGSIIGKVIEKGEK